MKTFLHEIPLNNTIIRDINTSPFRLKYVLITMFIINMSFYDGNKCHLAYQIRRTFLVGR